jgi:hypothetical protein
MQRSADKGEKRLLRERAKLADFGLLAVEGADLDELLHEAAAEVARSLDVRSATRARRSARSGHHREGQAAFRLSLDLAS